MTGLNPSQQDAVETVSGPLLIIAGAGSGKTRVITHRIFYLMDRAGVRPEQVLAVTFTNKAGEEMKSRVDALMGAGLRRASPLISTFHSLCVRILRRDVRRMSDDYTRSFTIYDSDDQLRLVRQILKDLGWDDRSMAPRQMLSAISAAKNRGLSPAGYVAASDYQKDRRVKIGRVYELYEQRLVQSNALDFDDLLIKAVELLRRVPEVRDYYHERFRHVLIDEFQDTNGIQYQLARLITVGRAGLSGGAASLPDDIWNERSLCVVGDLDQSIYGFRGSDFNIILNFQKDFPGTKTIKLEQNYRSTQTILDAANRLIENNRKRLPKTLYATRELGAGDPIRYYQSYDGEGEAAFIADRIEEHQKESGDLRLVVLYRTNAQSRLFEEALRRRSIAYNIVGGFSFYERAEVKDVIAYLKLALNPNDDIAMMRVINSPPRGIGKTTLDLLIGEQRKADLSLWEAIKWSLERQLLSPRAAAAVGTFRSLISDLNEKVDGGGPLSEMVKAATLDTSYVRALKEENSLEAEGRLQNIEELVNAAVEAEANDESLIDFIDHAALVSDTDQYRSDARVTLMTMHSAKGLEFPIVFVAGLEEGLFPHSRAAGSEADLEEERRLCYVAITRAQKLLYVTHAIKRRSFGEEMPGEPSRFLNEVPLELMENLSSRFSWLGFARREQTRDNRDSIAALKGQGAGRVKRTSNYRGKTYNSVDAVQEFFKRRGPGSGVGASEGDGQDRASSGSQPGAAANATNFRKGTRVRHQKYGCGVVLSCEGEGEEAKLTVSFPGYGPKKFVAKFATLEKA
jgi:ATP-dependent DNA helicase UvrD/PcrA